MAKTLDELLKEKMKAEAKLADLRTRLGHPHADFMSVHDLAESEFKVWSAHLEDICQQIIEIRLKEVKK